jgi:phage head maturation protease
LRFKFTAGDVTVCPLGFRQIPFLRRWKQDEHQTTSHGILFRDLEAELIESPVVIRKG